VTRRTGSKAGPSGLRAFGDADPPPTGGGSPRAVWPDQALPGGRPARLREPSDPGRRGQRSAGSDADLRTLASVPRPR